MKISTCIISFSLILFPNHSRIVYETETEKLKQEKTILNIIYINIQLSELISRVWESTKSRSVALPTYHAGLLRIRIILIKNTIFRGTP